MIIQLFCLTVIIIEVCIIILKKNIKYSKFWFEQSLHITDNFNAHKNLIWIYIFENNKDKIIFHADKL